MSTDQNYSTVPCERSVQSNFSAVQRFAQCCVNRALMQYIKHEEQKKTVFRHKNKHREKSWKYDAPQSILTNFEVINIVMEY